MSSGRRLTCGNRPSAHGFMALHSIPHIRNGRCRRGMRSATLMHPMGRTLRLQWSAIKATCLLLVAVHASGCAPKAHPPSAVMVVDLGGGVKLELVRIPPGEFYMGGVEQPAEKPIHRVKLTGGFWLGKYEVTQEQWVKVMGTNPSAFAAVGETRASNPVERVSWEDCQEFIGKLNTALGAVVGGAFRLPSEAEWEYACRAGTMTRYSSGERDSDVGDVAWYVGNSSNRTHCVGARRANGFGLYDMHGNVWEWCRDWHSAYPTNALAVDPEGPPEGQHKVVRGGAWCCGATSCRSASRNVILPGVRAPVIGLRVSMAQSSPGNVGSMR